MELQKLLNIIDNNKLNNKHFSQIYETVCAITGCKREEVLADLQKLEDDKLLMRDNKNKYSTAKSKGYIRGKVARSKKGDYFCNEIDGNERILINKFNLDTAMEGDIVLAREFKKAGTGEIVQIIKRAQEDLIGTIKHFDDFSLVMPIDDKYSSDVLIEKNKTLNAKDGDKVLVHLTDFEHNNLKGDVTQLLSEKQSIDLDMMSIAMNNGFLPKFSNEAIMQAQQMPTSVTAEDINGRIDCRKDLTITIDGDDAKDFDDAIHLIKNEKGNYVLKVHIADVAHYVKKDSPIYKDAYERGTSVYLPTLTLPMLPEELSNGICSLNPNVDRLTMCYEMELNQNAEVIDFKLYESVIKSSNRMTYNNVNKIFAGDKELVKQYEHLVPMLNLMRELSEKLEKKAQERGNLNLSSVEPKFYLNPTTHVPEGMENREMGIGENLIENFMILANEHGNIKMTGEGLPFIHRSHGLPGEEKLKEFCSFLKEVGLNFTLRGEKTTKKDLQNFLKATDAMPDKEILHMALLRSMQKAKYSAKSDGHYGLGLKNYSHLTSPIRRLPDLINNYTVKTYLAGKVNGDYIDKTKNLVEKASAQSSEREIASTRAESDADKVAMAYVLEKRIGESFTATICDVTKNGVFVSADKLIEGYIRVEDLPGGTYKDNTKTKLILSQKVYKIFDKIKVKLSSVDKSEGWINFVPEVESVCENAKV